MSCNVSGHLNQGASCSCRCVRISSWLQPQPHGRESDHISGDGAQKVCMTLRSFFVTLRETGKFVKIASRGDWKSDPLARLR